MKKIVDIEFLESFQLLCFFENGEKRILNLKKVLKKSDKYAPKILNEEIFGKAKIGSMGQIYWENIAEITNLEGVKEPCEYDMSPDFVYQNSTAPFQEVSQ